MEYTRSEYKERLMDNWTLCFFTSQFRFMPCVLVKSVFSIKFTMPRIVLYFLLNSVYVAGFVFSSPLNKVLFLFHRSFPAHASTITPYS